MNIQSCYFLLSIIIISTASHCFVFCCHFRIQEAKLRYERSLAGQCGYSSGTKRFRRVTLLSCSVLNHKCVQLQLCLRNRPCRESLFPGPAPAQHTLCLLRPLRFRALIWFVSFKGFLSVSIIPIICTHQLQAAWGLSPANTQFKSLQFSPVGLNLPLLCHLPLGYSTRGEEHLVTPSGKRGRRAHLSE